MMMLPKMQVGQGTHVGALSVFGIGAEGPAVPGLTSGRIANVLVSEREGSPVGGELG